MYFFEFQVVFVIAQVKFLEVCSLVDIVARVYSYFFHNFCTFFCNYRAEMYIGDERFSVSIGDEFLFDLLQTINVGRTWNRQSYEVGSSTKVDSVKVDFDAILSKYDVRIGEVLNGGKACEFVCSETEFEKIKSSEKVFSSCRKIIDRDDWKDVDIFPSSAFFAWNKDNFGPMYLPKQGDTLNLHPRIAPIYKNIITLFEGNDFQSDTYHVRINQQDVNEFVPQKNYYFILNDDRTDKRDSRMYGPIPEEYIIGKVVW